MTFLVSFARHMKFNLFSSDQGSGLRVSHGLAVVSWPLEESVSLHLQHYVFQDDSSFRFPVSRAEWTNEPVHPLESPDGSPIQSIHEN